MGNMIWAVFRPFRKTLRHLLYDGTVVVKSRFRMRLRTQTCPEDNLSKSRVHQEFRQCLLLTVFGMQAAAWLGARVVFSFSKIDKQLEESGIFKRLERNPLPEDVLDGKEELVDECAEVCQPLGLPAVTRWLTKQSV
jgi:hypothetical protein